MDKIRSEVIEKLLSTLPDIGEEENTMIKQEVSDEIIESGGSHFYGYVNGHNGVSNSNNHRDNGTNGECNGGTSDLRKFLEPVDESRLTDLMNTYKSLNRTEQILFLLRIPTNGSTGSRSNELVETSNWLRANFTVDSQVAIPKEEVYQMYKKSTKLAKPVSTADFGKIVRQVFPEVKPRRLGQRGNSRYCYANIRKKLNPDVPTLPNIEPVSSEKESTAVKILNWAKKRFSQNFETLEEFSAVMENMPDLIQHQQQSQQASQTKRKRSGSSCSLSNQNLQQPMEKVPIPRLKREDSYTSDDPELQTYFSTDEKWPNLRRLLTNSTGNGAQFTPIQFRPPSAAAAIPSSMLNSLNGNGACGSKKKRHYSTAATITQQSGFVNVTPMTPRSQSVPLNSLDSNLFEDEYGGDSGIGSLSSTPRNPMLSSVSNEILKPNDNLIFAPQNTQDQLDDQILDSLTSDFEPVFDYDPPIDTFDSF